MTPRRRHSFRCGGLDLCPITSHALIECQRHSCRLVVRRPWKSSERADRRLLSALYDRHVETTATVVAIPVFVSQFFMNANGIRRVAPGAMADRRLHGLSFQFLGNWETQTGIKAEKIRRGRQTKRLRSRPFRSIERCVERACAWGCDVMAVPCLQQNTIASQSLQHYPAGGGIHLPEATCLGEREPQSGHLAKLSPHTLNQSFHVTPHFKMSFYGRTIVSSPAVIDALDCAAWSCDDPAGKSS